MKPNNHSSRQISGTILITCAAISFAANSTLAKIAYEYGATPLSVLTWRTALAAIAVFLVLKLLRTPISLATKTRWICIVMGALLAAYSYGLLGAIEHIPVALAVLIFYLYPIFTTLGSWILGQERVTFRMLICLSTALIGLGIALGFGLDFNILGISMAVSAAVFITILLLTTNVLLTDQDPRTISMHITFSATLILVAVNLLVGKNFPLPSTSIGVLAFLGAGIFYAFSIISMFVGMARIGAIKTGLFMNFEPVSSIIFGAVLLNQVLTTIQLVGASLVIIAIVAASRDRTDWS